MSEKVGTLLQAVEALEEEGAAAEVAAHLTAELKKLNKLAPFIDVAGVDLKPARDAAVELVKALGGAATKTKAKSKGNAGGKEQMNFVLADVKAHLAANNKGVANAIGRSQLEADFLGDNKAFKQGQFNNKETGGAKLKSTGSGPSKKYYG